MLYWSACADAASINQAQPTKRSRWKRLFFFHTYIYVYSFVFVFHIIALSMERTWFTFHCWLYSVQLYMWRIKILNLFTWSSDLSPHVSPCLVFPSVISEIWLLLQCAGSAVHAVWSRRFGAAQTMHLHKCDHVKCLLAHSQSNGRKCSRSLEPYYTYLIIINIIVCLRNVLNCHIKIHISWS